MSYVSGIYNKNKTIKLLACFLAVILLLLSSCSEDTGRVEKIGSFEMFLPDHTWTGKNNIFKVVLRKDDHLVMKVFMRKGSLEYCYRASTYLLVKKISDFNLSVGPYRCIGHRIKTTLTDVLVDQIFYSVSEEQTLRFDFFVENNAGLKRDDPEVIEIIQSVIELNGYDNSD